ncbi:hypothetical protein JQX13_06435 [Archangium violaceum]|uniref:hypothetical protein n=1 Tax=Archangium violaceum TaxID=83451 RepID=UPI00193B4B63|nr:hypothetical protein [Archangium violaceum]QRK09753.1 hypothetical protein JQX13_06435 [Archangium violaceum]
MKRLVPVLAALALMLGFAAPAQAVELVQVPLSSSLASTVSSIQPQCYYCTVLSVTAFDVRSSGFVSQDDAALAAFDWLDAQSYQQIYGGAGQTLTQAQFASALAGKEYEELPSAIQGFIGTYGNDYTVSVSSWRYMSAPDYYNFGDFYTLVFHSARKVVTVEVLYEYEW